LPHRRPRSRRLPDGDRRAEDMAAVGVVEQTAVEVTLTSSPAIDRGGAVT
jgi:hypothetical protein